MEYSERLAYYVPDFVHEHMQKLRTCIAGIRSSGNYHASGRLETFPNPGLKVGEVDVPLPPPTKTIEELLGQSKQAPFGLGPETIVDTSVRKTQEIDGAQVRFENPNWATWFNELVLEASRGLGVPHPEHVEAKLYKMLIYGKGGKFKTHQDTEREAGMFGTLVLCLPCKHTGGEVVLGKTPFDEENNARRRTDIYGGPRDVTLRTSTTSGFEASYLAWYADVHHTILEVKSGYRVVLTYNLVSTQAVPGLSAEALKMQSEELSKVIKADVYYDRAAPFILIPLNHQYTARNLRQDRLKGRDYHVALQLSKACKDDWRGYEPILGQLVYEVLGQSESERPVLKLQLLSLHDLEGRPLNLPVEIDLLRAETLDEVYTDRKPWEHIGGGYMGNQSAEVDDTYKDSVVLLAPSGYVQRAVQGIESARDTLAIIFRQWLVQAVIAALRPADSEDAVQDVESNVPRSTESAAEKQEDHDAYKSELAAGWRTVSTASLEVSLNAFREEYWIGEYGPEIVLKETAVLDQKILEDLLRMPGRPTLVNTSDVLAEFDNSLLPTDIPLPPTEPNQRQEKTPDSDGEV